jgi:fructose-specific phosphotransferase system IIC component
MYSVFNPVYGFLINVLITVYILTMSNITKINQWITDILRRSGRSGDA